MLPTVAKKGSFLQNIGLEICAGEISKGSGAIDFAEIDHKSLSIGRGYLRT